MQRCSERRKELNSRKNAIKPHRKWKVAFEWQAWRTPSGGNLDNHYDNLVKFLVICQSCALILTKSSLVSSLSVKCTIRHMQRCFRIARVSPSRIKSSSRWRHWRVLPVVGVLALTKLTVSAGLRTASHLTIKICQRTTAKKRTRRVFEEWPWPPKQAFLLIFKIHTHTYTNIYTYTHLN